jgi:hypothetical protein
VPSANETVAHIEAATSWDERIARIRHIPQDHGTGALPAIFADVARQLYVPHLGPDFAYVPVDEFYDLPRFEAAYAATDLATEHFTRVNVDHLAAVLMDEPTAMLPLRTLLGLTRQEFAASTKLVAKMLDVKPLSPSKVDAMERDGSKPSADQARLAAETIDQAMARTLFGDPPGGLRSKQDKPDTAEGWTSVNRYAEEGVPLSMFLHQRHYGGTFRQLLDATSEKRGNLIEDVVEALFVDNGVPYIRTGSHNQGDIEARFEVRVRPAPDFVVFDKADRLLGLLECKGANDGGTARDKALRFVALREESIRLGGVPLLAVLGGLGWLRVNDTLGPVVRDCDGRVFSVSNVAEMLNVAPFPTLVGLTPPSEPITT